MVFLSYFDCIDEAGVLEFLLIIHNFVGKQLLIHDETLIVMCMTFIKFIYVG